MIIDTQLCPFKAAPQRTKCELSEVTPSNEFSSDALTELNICNISKLRDGGSLTCVVSPAASPEVIPEDGAERSSVNENRASGFTASNYPSACCLLGNCTYSFIPFCILEKTKCP